MGSSGRHSHTHIDITHVRSRSPSPISGDELHENGVQVSPGEISPQYSLIQPAQSQSGSSSHPGEFVTLDFPNELAEGDGSDLASRIDPRERLQRYDSRSNSGQRQSSRRQPARHEPAHSRTRELQDTSPTESGDSTEEFLARRDLGSGMPRPQSYYAHNGYPHSSSSGSYAYPAVPHSTQMIPLQPQPMAVPFPPPYPPMAPGQPMPYPPHSGYGAGYGHPAGSQVSAPYTTSPYGAPTIVNYGHPPMGGYFPPQYPPQYAGQRYPSPFYPQQMAYPYMDYRMAPPLVPSPQPGSATASVDKFEVKKEPDPEEMFKRFAELMKEERAQAELSKEAQAAEKAKADTARAEQESRIRDQALRQAEDRAREDAIRAEEEKRIRDQALIQAAENARAEAAAAAARAEEERRIREEAIRAAEAKARADAAAMAERLAAEQRIREEARQEAIRAYEEKVRQAAEQAAREQQIRKEAADAALKAAAEEAEAKAAKAAAEKKIADEAAAAAKTAAEKEAAEAAAAIKEEAKKAQEEAQAKLKEAEEAAAKAKAEAEEAEKKAAAAAAAAAPPPPEKKAPVRFKDAIGRNYNFPWERCCRWRDMEGLIIQAFAHIEELAEHVANGRYDLIGPDKEIIMPNYWESTIEPDMHITMMMWPIPEPPVEEAPPPPALDPDAILAIDEELNARKEKKARKKKPGGLAAWMLGGPPARSSRSLKGEKRPDVAAKPQHGATEQGACIVM